MSTIKTETLSTPSNATVPVDTVVNGTAKAWVNFNGTGTVAIRRAFNVASITDNSTGNYTVNFTTAMADANYASIGMIGGTAGTFEIRGGDGTYQTTTTFTVYCINDGSVGSAVDPAYVNLAVFS